MIDMDIVLAKVAVIQRCLSRIRSVTGLNPDCLDDIDKQDIFVLNLQRAVQAAIDLGAHVVAGKGLVVPAATRDIFTSLQQSGTLSPTIADQMKKMCGFRNIAVHDYQRISLPILKSILTHNLQDLEDFYAAILAYLPKG
jgi:uncharacterized protein YutE (UPF0331/DUF86 family)